MSSVIKAIQEIYPEIKNENGDITDSGIQGGFIYWETKQDGSPLKNPIDGLDWKNTEYDKPSWDQIEPKLEALDLEEAKLAKLAEINSYRDQQLKKPTDYTLELTSENKEFNVFVNVELIIEKAIKYLNAKSLTTIEWRAADDTTVTLTIGDLTGLLSRIEERIYGVNNEYILANRRKDEVKLLTDKNDVEAYDVTNTDVVIP